MLPHYFHVSAQSLSLALAIARCQKLHITQEDSRAGRVKLSWNLSVNNEGTVSEFLWQCYAQGVRYEIPQ